MTDFDDALVAVATKTGMTPGEWRDFFSCTPAQQRLVALTYRDADWVRDPDRFAEVVSLLATLTTVAGAVSGVGSAIEVIRAL